MKHELGEFHQLHEFIAPILSISRITRIAKQNKQISFIEMEKQGGNFPHWDCLNGDFVG